MNMKSLIFTLTILIASVSFGQSENWCGTDQHMQKMYAEDPSLETTMHEHLRRLRAEGGVHVDRDEEYVIPVVVHILHDNGVGNISMEQVLSGIDMLNEDFNRENEDADETRDTETAPFMSEASDMGIRFELAKIDPDGNCTNGVQRRNVGSLSYNADNSAKHYSSGGLDAWNRNFYMNIWIVNSIESDGGTILGYAEFPYGGGSSNYGVIIRHDAYGTEGTASGDRTLTHEIGHCLGLLHTFQGGCHGGACDDNGDYCCDTPPVVSAQWSCSPTQNTCDEIPFGDFYGFDAWDQFENFMSYSPCQNMYTHDQAEIVHSNFATIGFLANLVDPENNLEVGVGLPAVLCKADFYTNKPLICAGDELAFFDASFDNVTEYNWTFEGGTPETSTDANPVIIYNTPGNYSVTLEVTDGVDTKTKTITDYITVMDVPGISLPYIEDFESIDFIPDNDRFSIQDEDEMENWELNDEVGYSGNHSIWLKNRGINNSSFDSFISGTIDLSEVDEEDGMIFTFKYAYKRINGGTDEWLRFYISNDCGENWVLRKNIHGDDLGPETQNASYTPESLDEWYSVEITNINATYFTSNFRYKFEFENDNGNNIYIDDINLYSESMVSIEEHQVDLEVSIYPNPGNNEVTLSFGETQGENVQINIYNTIGQKINTIFNGQLPVGDAAFKFDAGDLPVGIYYINVVSEEFQTKSIKFIKQ